MRLIASFIWVVCCLERTNAFVPWRPDVSHFDIFTIHAIKPSTAAVRRHELAIHKAEIKYYGRNNQKASSSKGYTRSNSLNRRQDKTSDPIDLSSDPSDVSYWIDAKFGPSKKSFRLVLDTGSADTWIPSSECKSNSCLVHETYGPNDSTTLEFTSNDTFSITYASGAVEGTIVKDSISIGSFTLTDVEFGLANTVSNDFVGFPVDGILGLGFPAASVQKVPTFIDNLVSQKIITKKIFGVHLHRTADNTGVGSVTFGDIDSARIKGGADGLKYYDLSSTTGLWSIRLDDVVLDGESARFEGGRNIVVDTGTALILIPPEDALNLHQYIPDTSSNGETFYIPCDTKISLEFQFGDDKYEISSKDYVGAVVDSTANLCLSLIVGKGVLRDGAWLVGDVFLRNVYSVYDMDTSRVGFGIPVAVANSPSPTETSMSISRSTFSSDPISSPSPIPEPPTTAIVLPTITRTAAHSTTLTTSDSSSSTPTSSTIESSEQSTTITSLPDAVNTTTAPAATSSPSRAVSCRDFSLFSSFTTFITLVVLQIFISA